MKTIKTRFEERFKPTPLGFFRDGKIWHPEYAPLTHESVLAFIAQELTLLAETVEKEVQNNNSHDWDVAIEHAATIIRAHAKDLEE